MIGTKAHCVHRSLVEGLIAQRRNGINKKDPLPGGGYNLKDPSEGYNLKDPLLGGVRGGLN
jgi:hypothetical protein